MKCKLCGERFQKYSRVVELGSSFVCLEHTEENGRTEQVSNILEQLKAQS